MTTATLPSAAATFADAPGPFYAAYLAGLTDPQPIDVAWIATTSLPPLLAWASESLARRAAADVVPLTVATVAELLYHDLRVDPDGLTADEAMTVVDEQLLAVHCDMRQCCADVARDLADHPDTTRYARCVLRAGWLLGIEP